MEGKELTSDDTIEMLKDIMYGGDKNENELTKTEAGSALWDRLKSEIENSPGKVIDIPF